MFGTVQFQVINEWNKDVPHTRKEGFLGWTLEHKKAAGASAGPGKYGAINGPLGIVTQGDM